jgi:hypothetical protein
MQYGHRVKNAFRHNYGHGGATDVPAGARTLSASAHGGGFRWLDPSVFPEHSIERHDAYYYGIRVPLENIDAEETI